MNYLFRKGLPLWALKRHGQSSGFLQKWLHMTQERRQPNSLSSVLNISEEAQSAIRSLQPVLALESTIITHGMPYPQNVETALEVERIVRNHNCMPATVAVISGKLCVGLSSSEIEWLGSKAQVVKASRRDLSFLLSQGLHGGTTVSATMIAAHLAGIAIFATGGIGGIHKDVTETFDISADLRELGRTPVTVVSAGIKSILDIPRTLEYLETEGVGVYTYGPTTEFPSFFTRDSGCHSPYNIQTPLDAAKIIATGQALGLNSGNLIAVPVPAKHEADPESINTAIDRATTEAKSKGIKGKHVTPYILSRVNELMGGDSLMTNIALIKNNAMLGSQIAVALSHLQKGHHYQGQSSRSFSTTNGFHGINQRLPACPVVVVGGINIDITASFSDSNVLPNGDTYHGSIRQSLGGVGRNIADGLFRLGQHPVFLSAIGHDSYKGLLEMECSHMDLSHVLRIDDCSSATYCAILDHEGALINGIGDFDIHKRIDRNYLSKHEDVIVRAPLIIFDGNIPADSMAYLTDICYQHNIPAFFEPTTVSHVPKLFASEAWRRLHYVSPNLAELRMLHAGITTGTFPKINADSSINEKEKDILSEVIELSKPLCRYIPNILTTIGQHGVVLVKRSEVKSHEEDFQAQPSNKMNVIHVPVLPSIGNKIVSVSGAGDCLVSAFVASILNGADPVESLCRGVIAASLSLQGYKAVPSTLTPQLTELTNTDPQWQAKIIIRG